MRSSSKKYYSFLLAALSIHMLASCGGSNNSVPKTKSLEDPQIAPNKSITSSTPTQTKIEELSNDFNRPPLCSFFSPTKKLKISLGLSTAQLKKMFPSLIEDWINENGPAQQEYKDKNYPGFKTYSAETGGYGFVFLDDCLVSFFVATEYDYDKLFKTWSALYGKPDKMLEVGESRKQYSWNDGKTEITVEPSYLGSAYVDAVNFHALVADFKNANGNLIKTGNNSGTWVISDDLGGARGFNSEQTYIKYLSSSDLQNSYKTTPAQKAMISQNGLTTVLEPGTKVKLLGSSHEMAKIEVLSGKSKGKLWWVLESLLKRIE